MFSQHGHERPDAVSGVPGRRSHCSEAWESLSVIYGDTANLAPFNVEDLA
jgi:hypothetical protein